MGLRFRSDYKEILCNDGSTKHVLRRVEDIPRAFELLVSDWSVKVNVGLKLAIDAIEASPAVEIKKELVRLHDRIGEIDATARTMFATAYQHWRGDPCNNQAFFDQAILNILNLVAELAKISLNLKSLKSEEKSLSGAPIPSDYFAPKWRKLPKHRAYKTKNVRPAIKYQYKLNKHLPPIKGKIRSSNSILDGIESELKKKSKQLKKEIRQSKNPSARTKRRS